MPFSKGLPAGPGPGGAIEGAGTSSSKAEKFLGGGARVAPPDGAVGCSAGAGALVLINGIGAGVGCMGLPKPPGEPKPARPVEAAGGNAGA